MKKIVLCSVLLITVNAMAQIPLNGLVAYYPFTGNASDSSGNGHHGTVNGATLTADRLGAANRAYLFNGIGDFIAVPNFNTILTGDEVSLSFWAISYQLKSHSAFLLLPDNSSDRFNVHINYDHNGTAATFWDYGNIFSNGRMAINPDPYIVQWNHYVFISSAAQNIMSIYRNGTLAATVQQHSPLIDKNKTLNIGGGIGSGSLNLFFNGAIDDVAIYNRVLTAPEIQQIYCTTPFAASITAYGNSTFCKGSDVYLVATPAVAVNYQWQKNSINISGATTKTYSAKGTGNYKCIITSTCNSSTSNVIHVTDLPLTTVTISAGSSTTFCAGGSVTFTGTNPGAGYTYQWYRGSVSLNGATGLNYTAYSPGTYKIVNTNIANGCARISNSITVVVNCREANPELIVGSVEPAQNSGLSVFPNPTAGSFTIQLPGGEDSEGDALIELFNAEGQKIYQTTQQFEKGQSEKEIIFGSDVKNGLYLLRFTINGKIYQDKVLIN